MLVPFTIDPDILTIQDVDLDGMKRHAALLKFWGILGQLVIPASKESDSRLYESLNKAPQKVQVLWRSALRNYWKCCGKPQFDTALAENFAINDENVCKGIQLLLLDDTRGELWGLATDEYSKVIARSLEICRFGHEDETKIITSSLALLARPIEISETPDGVWKDRFLSFSIASRVLTVVDRYAIKNFMESRASDISGLERFLIKLAGLKTPGKKIVNIYSAYSCDWVSTNGSRTSAAACKLIFEKLESFCQNSLGDGLMEININFSQENKFGKVNHYRYVRFDDKIILLLDSGLQPLSGNVVTKTCPVSLARWMSSEATAYRSDEKKLQEISDFNYKIKLN